jgi:hypothetical protein
MIGFKLAGSDEDSMSSRPKKNAALAYLLGSQSESFGERSAKTVQPIRDAFRDC